MFIFSNTLRLLPVFARGVNWNEIHKSPFAFLFCFVLFLTEKYGVFARLWLTMNGNFTIPLPNWTPCFLLRARYYCIIHRNCHSFFQLKIPVLITWRTSPPQIPKQERKKGRVFNEGVDTEIFFGNCHPSSFFFARLIFLKWRNNSTKNRRQGRELPFLRKPERKKKSQSSPVLVLSLNFLFSEAELIKKHIHTLPFVDIYRHFLFWEKHFVRLYLCPFRLGIRLIFSRFLFFIFARLPFPPSSV